MSERVRRRALLGRSAGLGGLATLGGLTALCGLAAGCAAPAGPSAGEAGEVYVALGRDRAIAILDPVTDQETSRISLAPLGEGGFPWRLGVSPTGGAAVVPLHNAPSIGLVSPARPEAGAAPGARPPSTGSGAPSRPGAQSAAAGEKARGTRRSAVERLCQWVGVGSGRRSAVAGSPEAAQRLTADARGRAYVLTGDYLATGPSYAAVVDLASGAVLRHVPLAAAGETVLALLASPDGSRLYVSVWEWDDDPATGGTRGSGRLVVLDTRDGWPLEQARLPRESAVTELALAASTRGRVPTLYAVLSTPGPNRMLEDWWEPHDRFEILALEASGLAIQADWPLPERPNALAVTPDGARAYLLAGRWFSGWSMSLFSLDLATGAPRNTWKLPGGCIAVALAPSGKLYLADVLGDRLWRVDTLRDTFLGSVPRPGAPMDVAVRTV